MKVGDVITRVRKIAGDIDVLQFSDADIFTWINDAAKECASDNQLLQKDATTTVTLGVNEYNLPEDILKLHSVRYNTEKLNLVTMNEFDNTISGYGSNEKGTPLVGYVWAGKLKLFPIPDNSTEKIVVSYTRSPVEVIAVSDAIDLPTMYHRRIVDYCLAMVAEQDDDMERYQMKMEEFKTGVQNLKDQPEWDNDQYPSITVSDRDMGGGWDYYG